MRAPRPVSVLLARYAALVQGICKTHGTTMRDVCVPDRNDAHSKCRKDIAVALLGAGLTSGEIGAIMSRHYTTAQYLYGAHDIRIPQRRQRARDHKAKRKGENAMSKNDKTDTQESIAKEGQAAGAAAAREPLPQRRVVARPVRLNRGTEADQNKRVAQRNDLVRDARATNKRLQQAEKQLLAISTLVQGDPDAENADAQFFIIGVQVKPSKDEPVHAKLEDGIWFSQAAAQEHFDAHRADYSKDAKVHGFKGRSQDIANLIALTE